MLKRDATGTTVSVGVLLTICSIGCIARAAAGEISWAWRDELAGARALYSQARYKDAETSLALFLKRIERIRLVESELAEVHAEAGGLYLELGRFGHAQKHLERSLALWERYPCIGCPGRLRAANNLVTLYTETQQLNRAEKLAEQTLNLRELSPSEEALLLHSLATLYYFRARYHDAESLLHKAIALLEQSGSAGDERIMYALVTIAPVLVRTAKPQQALDCVQRARRIGEEIFGPDDVVLARLLIAESAVYRALNQIPEATAAVQKALALLPDYLEPLLQAAWDEYALVLRQSGRKREAAAAAARSAEIRENLQRAPRNIVDVRALSVDRRR
jgi:tetratricopeptide (TPR) repeat protein